MTGLEAAIQAAQNFRNAVLQDIAALEALNAAMAGSTGNAASFAASADAMKAAQDAAYGAAAGQAAAGNASAKAGEDAAASAAGYSAQADAMKAASEAAYGNAAAQTVSAAASARSLDADQAELDTIRILTAAKIAVARAERDLSDAYDETAAGQIMYLALSRDVSQAALQDAVHFGVAGEAARKFGDDEAAAAGYVAQMADVTVKAAGEVRNAEFDMSAVTLASIDATLAAARAEKLYADAMKVVNGEVEESAKAAKDAGNRFHGIWDMMQRDVVLFGGVLGSANVIGKVAAWHVALDGLFEASVALGEALAALTVGIAAMAPASHDIYTHLEAVRTVTSALHVNIAPLTGQFRALGIAMAPQTVEAYGGALDLVNQNGHTLAQVASEVVTGIDDLVARLDTWMQAQSSTGKLLQNGVGFLHQFEQAAGNVAMAVDNLIRADPGTAHYLMDFVVLGTRALDVITEIPPPLLEAALALHSFSIWGGIAATQSLKLLNPLRSLSLAMGGVAAEETALTAAGKDAAGFTALKATVADVGTGFLTWGRNIGTAVSEAEGLGKVGAGLGAAFSFVNPVAAGITVLAAGVGALVYEMLQASRASQQFAATADKALGQDSATQYLAQYPQLAAQGLQGLSQALHDNERAWVPLHDAVSETGRDFKRLIGFNSGLMDGLSGGVGIFRDSAKAAGDFFMGMIHGQQAMNSVSNYTGALANLNQGQKNLLRDADLWISKGHSVADSFALLDLAGVRASDTFALARRKVKNLIDGYNSLAAGGSALRGNINAVTFASEQQDSKISALTQAWSAFISTVTGGESAFVGFAQQVQGTSALASATAATLNASNGKVSVSTRGISAAASAAQVSITGLSAASLQLRGSFTQAITQGSTLLNSLQTMASAAGLGSRGVALLTRAGRDMVAELLPMTQHSKAAVAELYALAQQAGYRGADSFKALAEWVGKVTHPMRDLDSITTQLTADSANLATDVKNLADAIGQNLNQAMAQALIQANGGQKAFDQFANAMSNSHETAAGLRRAASDLATQLIRVLGNTKSAHAEFDTFATAMGMSKSRADALWSSIEAGSAHAAAVAEANARAIADAINNIPSQKTISIIERATVLGGGGGGPSGAGSPFTRGMAGGGKLPGYGGGDVVPAWLEPGEAVVPKHLVPAVAPFLGAHHVPGFAPGGIIKGGGGSMGPAFTMSDVTRIWAAELWRMDREKFGKHSPIALAEMQAILRGEIPGRGFLPRTALGRLLGFDEHRDTALYAGQDIAYWKTLGERHRLSENEKRAIERLQHEIAKARLNDSLKEAVRLKAEHTKLEDEWWRLTDRIRAYEKAGDTKAADALIVARATVNTEENKLQSRIRVIDRNYALVHGDAIRHLRQEDARKFRAYTEQADLLEMAMGYRAVPFTPGPILPASSYDKGGYLPVGLSMAFNGTGKPEPVGGAGMPDVHLHLHGDLARDELWENLQVRTLDYNFRNSGGPTGAWQPGG